MKKNLFAYKVGLGVIGLFVLILAVFVIMQANSTKQDAVTDKAANKIADKLNENIDNKQAIPDSLATAGITDTPSTITFKKLDAKSYKFCATYKANSSGFDATGAVLDAASGTTVNNDPGIDGPSNTNTKYSLYIDPTHHKGENCQTIKPLIYQSEPSVCPYNTSTYIRACPAANPSIDTPEIKTSTSTVCGYGVAGTNECKLECTLPTNDTTLRYVEAQVTKVSTAGGFSLTVKDTKGYLHVVKFADNGQVFNDSCVGGTGKTGEILVGDKVRVVAVPVDGKSVVAGDSNDNFTSTEIVDFSE